MVITRLEEIEKAKFKVYVDDEYVFLLYRRDIEEYGLQEEWEISQSLYDKIIDETVLRRAKQKAVAVLKYKDRTEHELRGKLSDVGYPEIVIDKAISYVQEYGYLNDERYVNTFIKDRVNLKSKMVIKTKLFQKGINRDLIDSRMEQVYEEAEIDSEALAIQKAILKKTKNIELLDANDIQKLVASLYRKGFSVEKIRKELKNMSLNC